MLTFKKENEYLTNHSYSCCLHEFGDDQFYGGGDMAVASTYPASRIVVKPINCKYTKCLKSLKNQAIIQMKTTYRCLVLLSSWAFIRSTSAKMGIPCIEFVLEKI